MIGDIDETGDNDLENEVAADDIDSDADDIDSDADDIDSDADDIDSDEVDNVGDLSVEIDVSELVADIELTDAEEAERKQAVRRRLEELNEAKEKALDSTYNISLDDD